MILGAHDQPRPEVVVRTVLWGLDAASRPDPSPSEEFIILDEAG